jgi:FMN phosphatase YigB (HAD superfamily)
MYLIERSGCLPFAFIAHPKTGSSATRTAIRPLEPSAPASHHRICKKTVQRVRHERGVIACTVRNPFDTHVSWYYYQEENVKRKAGKEWRSFDEWLEAVYSDQDEGTAQRWIRRGLHYGRHLCNQIIRFEKPLEPQLNAALAQAGIPPVSLTIQNATERLPYRLLYTYWSRRFIQQKWQRELDELGYSY